MTLDINEASKFDVIIAYSDVDSKKIRIFLFNPAKVDAAVTIGTQLQQHPGIRVCKEETRDSRYFVLSQDVDLSQTVDDLVASFVQSDCSVRASSALF